jgi:hypothetical protein
LTLIDELATIRGPYDDWNPMKTPITMLLIGVLPILISGCRSPYYADQGAALGALTGGLAGAAIGEHNNNPLAGVAIGSAVGALTGATVGSAIDQDVARSQAEIERQMGRRMVGAVTVPDVISMTEAGLSDSVITAHIHANGVARRPTAQDLVVLSQAGVREQAILAMQQSPPADAMVSPQPRAQPVIVEEYHYGPGPFVRGYHQPHRHHGPRHARNGVHWGISVGH